MSHSQVQSGDVRLKTAGRLSYWGKCKWLEYKNQYKIK